MKKFGENLKSARKTLNMNQQALGDAVGVGQTTIANYEKGLRFPTGDLLIKIAEILNVSIDDLLDHQVITRQVLSSELDIVDYQKTFLQHLLNGEEQSAIVMIWDLNPSKDNFVMIYEQLLMTSMYEIGVLWKAGKVSVATEHFASHVVHKIIAMLSTIPATMPKNKKRALCMSLSPEPHTIGVKMVSEYMNFLGLQSYYLGTNVPTDSLIAMLIKKKIDVFAISVTLSNHLDLLNTLIPSIKSRPELKKLKIIVGGQGAYHQEGLIDPKMVDGFASNFDTLKQWLTDSGII